VADLNKLSPAALSAAMRGGTDAWGQHGSAMQHVMYVESQTPNRGQYRKCRCGCGGKAKFRAMANGVCLASGCELDCRRFVRKYGKSN
jgi:hypothetical protein